MKRNFLWQSLGQGLGKIFTLFFYILLPKQLGLETYGEFTFILSIALISFQPFMEMGLDIQLTKWVSRYLFSTASKVLYLRIYLGVLLILLNLGIAFFFQIDFLILLIILCYLFLLNWQNTYFAFFRGLEKMHYEAIIVPLQKLLTLIALLSLGTLNLHRKLFAPLALTLSLLPGLIFISCQASKFWSQETDLSTESFSYREILQEGLIMGAASLLWTIYFRVDSVMLGIFSSNSEIGIYNLAYKIMEAPIFFPSIIMTAIFPKLAKPQHFKRIFRMLLIILIFMGMSAFVVLYTGAATIISGIYGDEFSGAIDVLKILAIALFSIYIGHLTTQSLIALDISKTYLLIIFAGTLANMTLNYWAIPDFGATGAAWTTVVTEFLVMLVCWIVAVYKTPGFVKQLQATNKEK